MAGGGKRGRYEKIDWYETPLYYDIVFDVDTGHEADFLESVFERHVGSSGKRVLEPACGTGRLLAELAKRGYSATGFDAGEAMLEFAKLKMVQQRVKAVLKVDLMESFTVRGAFDMAFCLLSTVKYLDSEEKASEHLRRVRDCLKPGGVYVLGVHLADYSSVRPDHERWVAERDGVKVVCNTRTWPPDRASRRERIRNRLRVERDGGIWEQESEWWCRTYDAGELASMLERIDGLDVVACYDFNHEIDREAEFGDDAGDVVLVLKKE